MPIDQRTHHQLERSLDDIDWAALRQRSYSASPVAWEDEVLYFLLLDRFSDGRETDYRDNLGQMVANGSTPRFRFTVDAGNAERSAWAAVGDDWLGGTLKGLQSKLGYLKRLGVTALWISPVFKQATFDRHSYHGYGIQNFLDVDPHFGSRQDLIELVDAAHALGLRVILDIILNHAGDVFGYEFNPERYPRNEKRQHRHGPALGWR